MRFGFFDFKPSPWGDSNINSHVPKLVFGTVSKIFPNGECALFFHPNLKTGNVLFKSKEAALRSLEE